MSVNEGGLIGAPVPLIASGPTDQRFNVVITGDGYANTTADQDKLAQIANGFAAALQQEPWWPVLGPSINVFLQPIWSMDSGVVLPTNNCADRRTYFDTTYCEDPNDPWPTITGETVDGLHALIPFTVHTIGITLNTGPQWGLGTTWGDFFYLGEGDWPVVALHEFGHSAFGLGDEYDGDSPPPNGEPPYPNLTIASTRETLKWRAFVDPDVPIPTVTNPSCGPGTENLPNPLGDPFKIGLFEGAYYRNCGAYRPAQRCKMNGDESDPFCRVCVEAARATVAPFANPAPNVELISSSPNLALDFGRVPFGQVMYRTFELRNTRVGFPAPVDVSLAGSHTGTAGSAAGNVGPQAAEVAIPAQAPGPIQATIQWQTVQKPFNASGSIAAAPVLGSTTANVQVPVEAAGSLSLSVTWTSAGPLPAGAINLDLTLYNPSNAVVAQAAAAVGTSETVTYTVPAGATGQYRLEITNSSASAASYAVSGQRPGYPVLDCVLRAPGGAQVASVSGTAPPASLSYTVPPGAIGTYTLQLTTAEGSTAYTANYTYPTPNSALPGPFLWAAGTETEFTLPAAVLDAASLRTIAIGLQAPDTPGVFDAAVLVTTSDPAHPSFQVTLHGESVPPEPVDSVLVIDRSGSMSEPSGAPDKTKTDAAIEAGRLYVSLLRDTDRIGVVRYNNESLDPGDVLLDMTQANAAGRAQAEGKLNPTDLNATGSTSIGAGIIRGSDVLDGGGADARAIVALTDGIQNTSPSIQTGRGHVQTKSPAQRVFAVGLGLNQLDSSFVEIASVTNGFAQITGDLGGANEFLLQKLYVQILADASGQTFVTDPRLFIPPGEEQATDVLLSEIDHEADFIVAVRKTKHHPKATEVWLEAPDGTLVAEADAGSMVNVTYEQREAHCFYRVQFPLFPNQPGSQAGRWRIWVANRSSGRDERRELLVCSPMCKARSDLLLEGELLQKSYTPGSEMRIVLKATIGGLPVKLGRGPTALVRTPGGDLIKVRLKESGDVYRGRFRATKEIGTYLVSTEVVATSPAGHDVTRYRHMTGVIFGRPRKPRSKPRPKPKRPHPVKPV